MYERTLRGTTIATKHGKRKWTGNNNIINANSLYMRHFKIIIILALFLTACEKEKVECNCGLVVDDNVSDYSVIIRNDCSKNEKKFYLQPGDWINAHVGSNYCITNVDSW